MKNKILDKIKSFINKAKSDKYSLSDEEKEEVKKQVEQNKSEET